LRVITKCSLARNVRGHVRTRMGAVFQVRITQRSVDFPTAQNGGKVSGVSLAKTTFAAAGEMRGRGSLTLESRKTVERHVPATRRTFDGLAGATGLEPATSGVTGRNDVRSVSTTRDDERGRIALGHRVSAAIWRRSDVEDRPLDELSDRGSRDEFLAKLEYLVRIPVRCWSVHCASRDVSGAAASAADVAALASRLEQVSPAVTTALTVAGASGECQWPRRSAVRVRPR